MSIDATSSFNTGTSLKPDFAQMQQALFNKADSNGDGTLSQDELQTMMEKNPRLAKALSSLAPTSDGSAPTISAIMKKLDTNGDGTISFAELTAGLKQARANMRAQGSAPVGGNDGDQDDSGGSTASASNGTDLQTLLEQFLAKLQSTNGPAGSSTADTSTSATTPTDTSSSSTVSSDKTLADLLSEILAQMKQQNGYAQNGTTNTGAGANSAILQTVA